MKKLNTAMIPTLLLLAGSALAQGQADPADIQRRSTDMMIPPALTSTVLGNPSTQAAQPMQEAPSPMSDADRRARETTRNTHMMRPQGLNSRSATGTTTAPAGDEDDRRMAEIIRRTDQMKPN